MVTALHVLRNFITYHCDADILFPKQSNVFQDRATSSKMLNIQDTETIGDAASSGTPYGSGLSQINIRKGDAARAPSSLPQRQPIVNLPAPPLPGPSPVRAGFVPESRIVKECNLYPNPPRTHGMSESPSMPSFARQNSRDDETIHYRDEAFTNESLDGTSWETESARVESVDRRSQPMSASKWQLQSSTIGPNKSISEQSSRDPELKSLYSWPPDQRSSLSSTTSSNKRPIEFKPESEFKLLEVDLPERLFNADSSCIEQLVQYTLTSLRTPDDTPRYKQESLKVTNRRVQVFVSYEILELAKSLIEGELQTVSLGDGKSSSEKKQTETVNSAVHPSFLEDYLTQLRRVFAQHPNIPLTIRNAEQLHLLLQEINTFLNTIQDKITEGYIALTTNQTEAKASAPCTTIKSLSNNNESAANSSTSNTLVEYSTKVVMALALLQIKLELVSAQTSRISLLGYSVLRQLLNELLLKIITAGNYKSEQQIFQRLENIFTQYSEQLSFFANEYFSK